MTNQETAEKLWNHIEKTDTHDRTTAEAVTWFCALMHVLESEDLSFKDRANLFLSGFPGVNIESTADLAEWIENNLMEDDFEENPEFLIEYAQNWGWTATE